MPQPGEVLCYRDYRFENGSSRDKLFVVLNAADSDTPCLLLKTTSQPRRYLGVRRGCNLQKRVFFVPADWGKCFDSDTYIQLPEIVELPTAELLRGAFSNLIYRVNSLSSDCFAQLKNCLKQFKQDIAQQHWELIFQS